MSGQIPISDFEDRHVAMLGHKFEPNSSAARRVEVFVGTGRRRRWSSDEKARIVEETLAAGAVASEVADASRDFPAAVVWLATGRPASRERGRGGRA